jgi:hypothetical protein
MNAARNTWNEALLRAATVAVSGMVLGFILYRFSIFKPTMMAFQFTISSITVGIMYAARKTSNLRNGFAALFVWYVIVTGLIEMFNTWLLILNLVYIAGMAAATFVHQTVVQTRFGRNGIGRVVLAGGIMSIANGLIVAVLALFSMRAAIAHATELFGVGYHNLQLGALIGIGTGLGMEIADYVRTRMLENASEKHDFSDTGLH